jgi:AcrR family transcriptional regulator
VATRPSSSAPKLGRTQEERTALSDLRLTEAAIELMIKNGIQGTTLQAVGEMAGYSRGLATHRFGSKAGLFAKVLQVASADWLHRMQAGVGKHIGCDALCAAIDSAENFFKERPGEVRAMYLIWFLSIDPSADYRADLAKVHRAQRRDAAAWIRAGQRADLIDASLDPIRTAEQYVASMSGIAYQWMADPKLDVSGMFRQLKLDLRARLTIPAERRTARTEVSPRGGGAYRPAS